MPHFRSYVVARGLRMYREVIGRYPDIELFAPSAAIDHEAFEDAPIVDLKANLGIDDGPADLDETPEVVDGPATRSDERAVRRRPRDGGRRRRRRRSSVRSSRPPRTSASRSGRTAARSWSRRHRTGRGCSSRSGRRRRRTGGRLSIYRWAPAIAEFFPAIEESAARDALGPDGFGVLEREDVSAFIATVQALIEPAIASSGVAVGNVALSGPEIRRIAGDWLRANDPDRHGVHYYEIAHAVQAQGAVGGTDQMATVLGAMKRGEALFEAVGPGTYTWATGPVAAGATRGRRYWAMRTDLNARDRLWPEIQAGRLRQGWGWDPEMDLELISDLVAAGKELTEWQQQAWANRRMLTSRDDAIHVGDIILVPHMPERRRFSLVRVIGPYRYDGGQAFGDYGHILPVELLTAPQGIGYTDATVAVKLQTSLGNRIRLWNLDRFARDIEVLGIRPD